MTAGRIELLVNHREIRGVLESRPRLWIFMVLETDGNEIFYGFDKMLQLRRRDFFQGAAYCSHPTSDVHSNGVGNHRIDGGKYTADGHPKTFVCVGHEGYMVVGVRQIGDVFRLLQGARFKPIRPYLDRYSFSAYLKHSRLLPPSPP